MDVSIIIVNYNTKDLTMACIDSVCKFTKDIEYEILLVDNASTDGSKEYFSNKTGIKYIYLEDNIGFGKGNNTALPYAEGRNILFLNSDTLLINNAIKILSNFLDKNLDVSVCGGNLYGYDMKPSLSFERKRLSISRELNKILRYIPLKLRYGKNCFFNNTETPCIVGYVSGADLMTRRETLKNVGGFSPDFFMYYEESELQERLSRFGKISSVPQAKIQHLEGASTKGETTIFNRKKCKWMYESELIYLKKHKNKFESRIIWNLTKTQVLIKMMINILLNKSNAIDNCKQEFAILKDVQNQTYYI